MFKVDDIVVLTQDAEGKDSYSLEDLFVPKGSSGTVLLAGKDSVVEVEFVTEEGDVSILVVPEDILEPWHGAGV